MNPKMHPQGVSHIAPEDIEIVPTATDLIETYDKDNQNERKAINIADLLTGQKRNARVRCTVAELNAAGGKVIVPALPGYKIRIVDAFMIAYGGAVTGATSIDLIGTRGAAEVRPAVHLVAGLTQSTVHRMGAANSTVLADGASHTPLDAGTALKAGKQAAAGNAATATGVDINVTYVYER